MPNQDGYHDAPFFHDGRMWVWHHCQGADRDVLVQDTEKARKDHLRDCNLRRLKAEHASRSEARRRSIAALSVNRHRREAA